MVYTLSGVRLPGVPSAYNLGSNGWSSRAADRTPRVSLIVKNKSNSRECGFPSLCARGGAGVSLFYFFGYCWNYLKNIVQFLLDWDHHRAWWVVIVWMNYFVLLDLAVNFLNLQLVFCSIIIFLLVFISCWILNFVGCFFVSIECVMCMKFWIICREA